MNNKVTLLTGKNAVKNVIAMVEKKQGFHDDILGDMVIESNGVVKWSNYDVIETTITEKTTLSYASATIEDIIGGYEDDEWNNKNSYSYSYYFSPNDTKKLMVITAESELQQITQYGTTHWNINLNRCELPEYDNTLNDMKLVINTYQVNLGDSVTVDINDEFNILDVITFNGKTLEKNILGNYYTLNYARRNESDNIANINIKLNITEVRNHINELINGYNITFNFKVNSILEDSCVVGVKAYMNNDKSDGSAKDREFILKEQPSIKIKTFNHSKLFTQSFARDLEILDGKFNDKYFNDDRKISFNYYLSSNNNALNSEVTVYFGIKRLSSENTTGFFSSGSMKITADENNYSNPKIGTHVSIDLDTIAGENYHNFEEAHPNQVPDSYKIEVYLKHEDSGITSDTMVFYHIISPKTDRFYTNPYEISIKSIGYKITGQWVNYKLNPYYNVIGTPIRCKLDNVIDNFDILSISEYSYSYAFKNNNGIYACGPVFNNEGPVDMEFSAYILSDTTKLINSVNDYHIQNYTPIAYLYTFTFENDDFTNNSYSVSLFFNDRGRIIADYNTEKNIP